MKYYLKKRIFRLTIIVIPVLLAFSFLSFSSFVTEKKFNDFFKQLGISKPGADEKITNSILEGSINIYGVKNAKNILTGNRKGVTLDLLNYTKNYVNTQAFVKQYNAMKEKAKPVEPIAKTPEEMRNENIAMAKKGVEESEAMLKRADPDFKTIFEKVLAESKKSLKQAEDPNNKQYVSYAKGYPTLVKDFKANHEKHLATWENKYPTNHLLYIKMRLQEFMNATADIDFNAELKEKSGKKVFVNPVYEKKDNRWKMAFRAGKEVVEPAREFVQKWLDEIQ